MIRCTRTDMRDDRVRRRLSSFEPGDVDEDTNPRIRIPHGLLTAGNASDHVECCGDGRGSEVFSPCRGGERAHLFEDCHAVGSLDG